MSVNVFDYKWKLDVWMNKTKTSLKLNNGCTLNNKFNDNGWREFCLNLIEPFYSKSWKLAVIDFLHTIGSPFTIYRIIILTWASDSCARNSNCRIVVSVQKLIFNFFRCRIAVSVQKLIFNSARCWLAVIKMLVCCLLQWLVSKLIVLSKIL